MRGCITIFSVYLESYVLFWFFAIYESYWTNSFCIVFLMSDMNNEIFSVFDRFKFFTCLSRFNAYVSKKRGSRYLKNASFDLADFFTQDSCYHSTQNEPWNKDISMFHWNIEKINFLKKIPSGTERKKFITFFFQIFWLIPWLISSKRVWWILCQKISPIEATVLEISWAPFCRCEKKRNWEIRDFAKNREIQK